MRVICIVGLGCCKEGSELGIRKSVVCAVATPLANQSRGPMVYPADPIFVRSRHAHT